MSRVFNLVDSNITGQSTPVITYHRPTVTDRQHVNGVAASVADQSAWNDFFNDRSDLNDWRCK